MRGHHCETSNYRKQVNVYDNNEAAYDSYFLSHAYSSKGLISIYLITHS